MFAVPLTAPGSELRPLEPHHAVEYLAHIGRARENVDRFVPWAAGAADLDSARAQLQAYADKQAADTGRLFGIWLDGTLVGGVMFVGFDTSLGNCELGCWLEPAAQGRGLVTGGVRVLLEYALVERGLSRAEWYCGTDNARSRAVAQRVGMTLEGVQRSSFPHGGVRRDMEVWAVLADEWAAPQA
ncbi:GNAT family N-acetyltransferase [Kitasatospora viridis]|uniref:RimJ/RimL family protein N-acetyltransferase n=1 Tax=Kitasatospora viridis TaxID=281105 RepID=A0A561UIG7_9ACTN|nr:GNAT family protein [Kitasatospora viridis]TWF99168.1 RimJ/RimL family protein N-acetyltransferase [Kitasatospora viridis]